MTATFQVRFTNPHDFIAEAMADHDRDAIAARILRMTTRKGHATIGDISADDAPAQAGDRRPAVWWRLMFVETAYLNDQGQLVICSIYCGTIFTGEPLYKLPEADVRRIKSEATNNRAREAARMIAVACSKLPDIEIRGGALAHEEGPWTAAPGNDIESLEPLVCATCWRAIYWSNGTWRHRDPAQLTPEESGLDVVVRIVSNRDEAYVVEPCRYCAGEPRKPDPFNPGTFIVCERCQTSPGERVTLHHLADPEEAGRKL